MLQGKRSKGREAPDMLAAGNLIRLIRLGLTTVAVTPRGTAADLIHWQEPGPGGHCDAAFCCCCS